MTVTGRTTLLAGALICVAGFLSGHPVLIGMGAVLVVAVGVALLIVGRPLEIGLERVVLPDRVTAGDPAVSELTITNRGRRSVNPTVGVEQVGAHRISIAIPALDPDESTVVRHRLPTDRRGVFEVGPLTIRRGDPIGLARRGDVSAARSQLIVHPEVHRVNPFPAGTQRDMEGLPSGEAIEGGITFANLREYVPGDDLRLVHWRSSAKTGTLMVRHNIDVHHPRTMVILDVSRHLYDEESFEDAVRAAASVVGAAMHRRFPFTLRTSDDRTIDDRSSATAVMDFLAAIRPTDDETLDLGHAALHARRDPMGLSCACITGRAGVDALRSLGPIRNRFERLILVRMGSGRGSEVHVLTGAVLINARTSLDFASAWNGRVRT